MVATRTSRPPVYLLGAASGLSPFGVTIIVPILALIGARFDASFGHVQFLVSAYLFGLAAAQPFNGFLCDRFGRRPVLLSGFGLFVIASLALSFATSLDMMIGLRFLQAVGVSVGTVASRAVVRDMQDASQSTETLSYIAAAMGFAPILAPMLGGWLGEWGGYTAVFLATAAMGTIILAWAWLHLPETLDPSHARAQWSQWMSNYSRLLSSLPFLGFTLVFGFVQGCFFSFLAVGAAVFETNFGMGEKQFGLLWGLMAITYVTGALIAGRLYRLFETNRVMQVAVMIVLLGGWIAVAAVHLAGVSLLSVLVPMGILMAVAGAVTPGSLAGAVNLFPHMAGTSSGLSSALGIVIGGMFTILGGFFYQGDYRSVTWLIAVSASLTALSWLLVQSTRPTTED